jgi:hypothetical protein
MELRKSCHVAGRSACHCRFAYGIGSLEEQACLTTKLSLSSRKKCFFNFLIANI